jgi:hypothetical protein
MVTDNGTGIAEVQEIEFRQPRLTEAEFIDNC